MKNKVEEKEAITDSRFLKRKPSQAKKKLMRVYNYGVSEGT